MGSENFQAYSCIPEATQNFKEKRGLLANFSNSGIGGSLKKPKNLLRWLFKFEADSHRKRINSRALIDSYFLLACNSVMKRVVSKSTMGSGYAKCRKDKNIHMQLFYGGNNWLSVISTGDEWATLFTARKEPYDGLPGKRSIFIALHLNHSAMTWLYFHQILLIHINLTRHF